jgi:hypothetical protein
MGIILPYRHGFLTKRLRAYLKKDRKTIALTQKAVYDHHLRETVKQSLKDVVFILEKLDKKQFDQVSNSVREDMVRLLSIFAMKSVDRSHLKHPYGRIEAYRLGVATDLLLKGEHPMSLLCDIAQDALDNACGKGVVYAQFLTKRGYLDYEDYIQKRTDMIQFKTATG